MTVARKKKKESSTTSSLGSDIEVNSILYNFPTQIICLECLDGTLDSLLNEENEMDSDEWRACLFQIIIMLIIYQKVFHFTHNDLHTNNIMFKKQKSNFYIIDTIKNIIKFRHLEKSSRSSILDELSINIKTVLSAVIVTIQKVTQLLNTTVNHILIQKNQD